jgi:HPt (histidine-containing phosphotransfer) domain-containing protein
LLGTEAARGEGPARAFATARGEAGAPALPAPDPILDPEALLGRVAGDRALLRELVAIFTEDAPGMLERIAGALAADDSAAVAKAAHALKGSVGVFSAGPAAGAAAELEQLARSGELSAAGRTYATLEREVARLAEELARLAAVPQAAG